MKKLMSLAVLAVVVYGCNVDQPLEEVETSLKRMPFNERVFMLNSVGNESRIYEVDYDFQGLGDEAVLNRLTTDQTIPNGGHMTMSPDNEWLTVVVSSKSKIYLVNVSSGEVKVLNLYDFNPDGMHYEEHFNNRAFTGQITQVDVDQDGFLFIAGKAGFYKVVADNGNGVTDPSLVNEGADIWSDTDPTLCEESGINACGQVWVHAVPFTFSGDAYVESTDDGEDYFDELTTFNPKRVKFYGGDILFTQNSTETDGFESQRLISFSQWQGNISIALDLTWDWASKEISFTASKVFGGNGHAFHNKSAGRVTGAALTGDNMVLTSHNNKSSLYLWNLYGDLVTEVSFTINDPSAGDKFKNGKVVHNWGDMASTQSFDKNSENPDGTSSKEIEGEYSGYWDMSHMLNHQYAEIKLYRPGAAMSNDPNNLSEEDYNSTPESRANAANADIADYNKNGSKFVSLGKSGGYAMFRFSEPVTVKSGTKLQVVETSWNRNAIYSSVESAFSAYPEKVSVYVLKGETPRYYSSGLESTSVHDWVLAGTAGISHNELTLADADLVGETIQWVMIKDDYSTTPDGYDLNFVSIYEEISLIGGPE